MTLRVALTGCSGFIGSHARDALIAAGHEVVCLNRDHLPAFGISAARSTAALFHAVASIPEADIAALVGLVNNVDCVVNAAGAADPDAASLDAVFDSNAVLPLLLQRAVASSTRCKRLVHVSSAAVQGSRTVLDETVDVSPLTPYAESKALAESALIASEWAAEAPTIIYRPTSVHGTGRPTTANLIRAVRNPLIPMVGSGLHPLPIANVTSVARAIVHLVGLRDSETGLFLHPSEGVTQRLLLDRARQGWRLKVPQLSVPALRLVLSWAQHLGGPVAAKVRRVEILLLGQEIEASRLCAGGFVLDLPDSVLRFLDEGATEPPKDGPYATP